LLAAIFHVIEAILIGRASKEEALVSGAVYTKTDQGHFEVVTLGLGLNKVRD
jgi:hypothetical protein